MQDAATLCLVTWIAPAAIAEAWEQDLPGGSNKVARFGGRVEQNVTQKSTLHGMQNRRCAHYRHNARQPAMASTCIAIRARRIVLSQRSHSSAAFSSSLHMAT